MHNAHPGLMEFDYIKPASLAEASKFLQQHAGEARPFLGGTDTFVRMRDGAWKDKFLVDVKGLEGTTVLAFDPKHGLTIGAAVPMNRVIAMPEVQQHYPLLAEAAHSVASYQLRSRATIVGNICNASPAGDTIGTCIALGGVLKVYGADGYREEPLATFFKGPGKTALKPGDIAISLHLPLPPKGAEGKYIKLGRNKIGDLCIVGVTVLGYPDAKAVSGLAFRIVLASVAATPLETQASEDLLSGRKISDAVLVEAAQVTMDSCTPIDDIRGGARYRKLMVRNLTLKALREVWGRLNH
jgi:CO/xanthine dehydrogenase FAD-binding subunit